MNFAAIADWDDSEDYPVDFMCAQLGVSRSGFYAWRGRGPSERISTEASLTEVIKTAYQRLRGNPGVRRVHAELRTLGHRLSRERVWRLMHAAELQGRHPRAWKRTTVPGDRPVPAPDLLGRAFAAERPDARWCGDITYIKTWEGWAYLATGGCGCPTGRADGRHERPGTPLLVRLAPGGGIARPGRPLPAFRDPASCRLRAGAGRRPAVRSTFRPPPRCLRSRDRHYGAHHEA